MNICIAVKQLKHSNGGVCTHVLDLCREFIRKGHKVVLLSDKGDYDAELLKIDALKYVELPFETMGMNVVKMRAIYKAVASICKEEKIDILHLHTQSLIPIAWRIRRKYKIPFLWTNHIDEIPQPKLLAFMHKAMKFPVISVSKELKDDLMQRLRFKDEDLFVVNNGIDFEKFQPLKEEEVRELKNRFNIQDGEFIVAELSRINPIKGQDLLIRAVDELQKKFYEKKFHVLFAGEGRMDWFEENVAKYAQERSIKMSYLGFQSPRAVFGMAHLSVLPSSIEGFALVAIESFAMHCPVVRSDSPGFSSMQEYCKVFPKQDLNGLVAALEECVEHYDEVKSRLIKRSEEIEALFSVRQMGAKTLEIYEYVLRK